MAAEHPPPPDDDVRLIRLGWWPLSRQYAAITIGRRIFLAPHAEATALLLAHELAHVAQWRRWGWTFPVRYAWAWIRAGFNYDRIPYELRADRQRPAFMDRARALLASLEV